MAESSTRDVNIDLQSVHYYRGEGPIHRLALHPEKLLDNLLGRRTVQGAIFDALRKNKANRSLGSRRLQPDGTWSGYEYLTYGELEREIVNFASGMSSLKLNSTGMVGIYSENRLEWIVSVLACCYLNITFVPLYDSVAQDTIQYIIDHSGMSAIVLSEKTWEEFASQKHDVSKLSVLIKMGKLESVPEFLKNSRTKIHEYEEVKRMAGSIHPMVQSSPEDLFTLLYTSGTSGEPKGVMLTELNAACSIAGCLELIKLSQSDVHISYLPLAHSYEMVCMLSGLLVGASAGFWRGDINGLLDDIQALRPTILVGVPRVFDRIYGRIMCGLEEASRVKRALFSYAYDSKRRAEQVGGASSIWEGVIFKRFKDLLGKRVRMIVSGSAPLNPKVQEFLRVVTGATVIQGYGLTETFALVCVQRICDKKATGHVGPPIGTVEVKLVDVPELGYVSSVDQHRGEVCVRGTNVFVGYYKDEAKTSDVLEPDGWFHTGDVGEWLPNGTLRIIDRKKNIFKLSQGEYVAVDNLESVFSQARFVGQIYIHGDSMSDYLVAIVVPDAEALVGWAELAGMSKDVRRLCADTKVKTLIYEELCKVAKENQLHGYQIPRQIYLEPDPWTVESGVLTPSLKTKRFVMRKMYEAVFKELYRLPRLDGSNGRAKL